MEIREAKNEDIPEIVEVLKASLGETDLPLTEEIWNFKHSENPFGESLVLLAVEDQKIIGVRALMRWQWRKGEKTFSALRAVDTATHPGHQGKGVFKKLTLQAIELAKQNGDQFVFNTPNEKSRPGYLKMGWQKAGNLRVGISPAFRSFWKVWKNELTYKVSKTSSEGEIEDLCLQWNKTQNQKKRLFTPKSGRFLQWRYEKNPLQTYEVLATPEFYLAVYVKKRKNFKELRVAECIFNHKESERAVRKAITSLASKFGVQIISFSPMANDLDLLSLRSGFGPILTVRDLNLSAEENNSFVQIDTWGYSLGDLELF